MSQPQQLARRGYEAFAHGDIDFLVDELFDPEIEWAEPEAPGYPFAGTHVGVDAFVEEVLGQIPNYFEELCVEPEEILAQGDVVVTLGHYRSRTIGGEDFVAPFVHVGRFRDGRLIRVEVHTDTALVVDSLSCRGTDAKGRLERDTRPADNPGGPLPALDPAVHGEKPPWLRTMDAIADRCRELERLALYDELTGLPNRRLLHEILDKALSRTGRMGELLAVVFLDLDDFKAVNDTWGHPAGDTVLRSAASRFEATVRAEDTVARHGGDEFVVVAERLPSRREARDLVERLVAVMRSPVLVEGRHIRTGASAGAALACHALAPETILCAADRQLYRAKRDPEHDYLVTRLPPPSDLGSPPSTAGPDR